MTKFLKGFIAIAVAVFAWSTLEVTGSFKVIFASETQGDAIAAVLQSLLENDVDVEDIRAYEIND